MWPIRFTTFVTHHHDGEGRLHYGPKSKTSCIQFFYKQKNTFVSFSGFIYYR